MPKRALADQLDQAVQAMIAGDPAVQNPELDPLLNIALVLRDLPRQEFKARLKSELERKASMASTATDTLTGVRQTATPRLRIKHAAQALEFYKNAFGARETMRFEVHGQIAHAEIEIGNSVILLGEAAPEYGYPGPEAFGGSPISIQLFVPDVDAFVAHAVEAGARPVMPVRDQFYGDRSGSIADPFGYTWGVATRKESMSVEEMHRRFEALEGGQAPKEAVRPEGFQTLTPYIIVQDAPGLIDFVKQVFGAEERLRTVGSAGGVHGEVRIGDSTMMIGGGAPELSWQGESRPTALHIYVEDTDAAYERALKAGAVSTGEPVDQPYGERSGGVRDRFGNHWYIATWKGEKYIPEGLGTVTPYLHPLRAEPLISFLKRGFGAEEVEKYASPDGVIHHAKIKIGDSVLEMGEAHGPYQPMPSNFYLSVPDVDAMYSRALNAGGTSTGEPENQPWGARTAGVKDAFGNQWYIATPIGK